MGFLVAACKLLVEACGIYFPDQGSNPNCLNWKHRVLATGPPGKSPDICILRPVSSVVESSAYSHIQHISALYVVGTVLGSRDRTEHAFLFSRRLVGKISLGQCQLDSGSSGLEGHCDQGMHGLDAWRLRQSRVAVHMGDTSWDIHVTLPAQGTCGQQMWDGFVWQSSCKTASSWGSWVVGSLESAGAPGGGGSHCEAMGGGCWEEEGGERCVASLCFRTRQAALGCTSCRQRAPVGRGLLVC